MRSSLPTKSNKDMERGGSKTQYIVATLDTHDGAEVKNFSRVPNMIIFGYHESLSPQEKWLYVCLKHMCGRKGTRHLSLRYISEKTGISTGALSKSKHSDGMIRHLHDAGLIHAQIKKPAVGNPQYHITITDVWALNQAFFSRTRSEFGQDEDDDAEPVRISDEPVHISDKLVQNSDEPVRNSSNTKITDKTITKTTEQDESMRTQLAEATQQVEKRITHPRIEAVSAEMLSDSQRLSETEEEPPLIPPRLTLPSKPAVKLQAVAAGQAPSPLDAASRQTTVLEHTPGTPPRPLAAGTADVTSRHGDAGSDQASRSLLLDSEPAQADFPPAGSNASCATTAQASGFVPPKRPRGKQPVVALTLMGSQVMQWIGEIRGAKPRMTSGNVRACNALAECDGMSKEALAAYFASIEAQNREVDLLTAAGETGNDKVGFLSFESNWPKLKKKLKGQDEKPQDKYTAASHDEERNERNLQRLRDRITARGEKPPC